MLISQRASGLTFDAPQYRLGGPAFSAIRGRLGVLSGFVAVGRRVADGTVNHFLKLLSVMTP